MTRPTKVTGWLASMLAAKVANRYHRTLATLGPGFIELRTPPSDLPRDSRGVAIHPPVQLFEPS